MTGRRIGVLSIARDTFDITLANDTVARARTAIEEAGYEIVGPPGLLTDSAAVESAVELLETTALDGVVVLQGTFADSTLVVNVARVPGPLVLWAFPEERTGERLRLNSLCGMNLAGFALTQAGRAYRWVYRDPDDPSAIESVRSGLADREAMPPSRAAAPTALSISARQKAELLQSRLREMTVGLIGDAPTGFPPCEYDAGRLASLVGMSIRRVELEEVFEQAREVSDERLTEMHGAAERTLSGLNRLETESVAKSLRLGATLLDLSGGQGWSGVAMRCWPETFDDFGAAACSALGGLATNGVSGCCERDVYGVVTAIALREIGDSSAFVADLVDLDRDSDTATFWHCGLASTDLADPATPPSATIHSNRKKPLLNEFALKPGRVTIARISQAQNRHALVIGGGEVVSAPRPYSGTAGVVQFDRSVDEVLDVVMREGLEHHYGIVYGDVRQELEALAAIWDIPVIRL